MPHTSMANNQIMLFQTERLTKSHSDKPESSIAESVYFEPTALAALLSDPLHETSDQSNCSNLSLGATEESSCLGDDSSVETLDDAQGNRTPKATHSSRVLVVCFISLLSILLVLLATLFIGARIELNRVKVVPSTLSLYTENNNFCSRVNKHDFMPFGTEEEAREQGEIVHCGDCGQCSNLNDMEIMARTRRTLTKTATKCAFRQFLGSDMVSNCMEQNVGFTSPCNSCWVDNIQCTFNACKYTCLKMKLFGESNNHDSGELNDCLKCDEVMCGPQFLSCSGANRRRMGIVSAIGRDASNEQCQAVEVDWANKFPAEA